MICKHFVQPMNSTYPEKCLMTVSILGTAGLRPPCIEVTYSYVYSEDRNNHRNVKKIMRLAGIKDPNMHLRNMHLAANSNNIDDDWSDFESSDEDDIEDPSVYEENIE